MSEMLANRYLMDGDLEKAAELYLKAIDAMDSNNTSNTRARCRLVAALALADRLQEAAHHLDVLGFGGGKTIEQNAVLLFHECKQVLPPELLDVVKEKLANLASATHENDKREDG